MNRPVEIVSECSESESEGSMSPQSCQQSQVAREKGAHKGLIVHSNCGRLCRPNWKLRVITPTADHPRTFAKRDYVELGPHSLDDAERAPSCC